MTSILSRRLFVQGLGGAVASSMLGSVAHAQDKVVRPLRVTWDSFWFSGYIAKTGLEALGYKVEEPRVMTPAALFQALAQGDADYTMDVVMPGATSIHAAVKDRVTLLGPVVKPGSVTGYLIDKRTAEKHGIKYVTDFRKPEIAALFSEGTDKRARLIGPGAGFGDEKRAVADVDRLGLKDTVNIVIGEYNVLVADVVARYKAGKPVFMYAWFPNVATVELMPGRDLVFLEEPGANPSYAFSGISGCASGGSSCNTGWLPTTYYVGAGNAWLQKNPAAGKFLGALRISTQDRVEQNLLMAKGEKRERDLMRHADNWIKANRPAFDAALAAARA